MFGNRYFAGRYFAHRYFPDGSDTPPQPTPDNGYLGGGGYVHPYQRYKEERARQEAIDREIAAKERELEFERAERLKAQRQRNDEINAQRLEAREAELSEGIRLLLIEKEQLIRRIDDEEAALVLLLSSPFSS